MKESPLSSADIEARLDDIDTSLTSVVEAITNLIALMNRLVERATAPRPKDDLTLLCEHIVALLQELIGRSDIGNAPAAEPRKAASKLLDTPATEGEAVTGKFDPRSRPRR